MTASITILKADGGTGAVAAYFASLTRGDYYTEGGERPGFWLGRGSKSLALRDEVTKEVLTQILGGLRPDGTEFSDSRRGSARERRGSDSATKRRPQAIGADLTFSVPKSVSTLWAVGPRWLRRAIERALEETVRESLAWFESTVPLGRRGKGGATQIDAGVVVGAFQHVTNRDLAPQLHYHLVFGQKVLGEDGRWSTINTKELRDWTRTLGPLMRSTLGAKLAEIGLTIERGRDKDGKEREWFEIAGVPRSLAEHWSPRRDAIEELTGADSTGAARQQAALETRGKKLPVPPREQMFTRWAEEAGAHGFTTEEATRLVQPRIIQVDHDAAYRQAFDEALSRITEQHATFLPRELMQHTAEALADVPMPGTEIASRVQADLENSPLLIRLGEEQGTARYTTRSMWGLESKLIRDVEAMRTRQGAAIDPERIEAVVEGAALQGEQADAARMLLGEGGSIRCVAGVAGAGKTTVLRPVAEALKAAGYEVLGGALSGAAKEQLASSTGIRSRTVASYLYQLGGLDDQVASAPHEKRLRPEDGPRLPKLRLSEKSVLIIDEAGMLDTRLMAKLLHFASKFGATVILAGDTQQLPPISAGAPFPTLLRMTESTTRRLTENFRQRLAPEDRDAAHLIRVGQAARAMRSYAERGQMFVGEDKPATIRELVRVWAEEGGVESPRRSMIFTQERREARVINELCQQRRLESGKVQGPGVQVGDVRVHKGDRVMFHKKIHDKFVENGFQGQVMGRSADGRGITILLDREPSPEARARGASRFVTLPVADLEPGTLTLAYAATTHKLQGQSVERSYMLLGGRMTNREMAYVQASRGREATRLFVDQLHAGEELADLVRAVDRSREKHLAHDIAERSGRTAIIERTLEREQPGGAPT